MSRWMLIVLFLIAAVTGYLAFGHEPSRHSHLIDAAFLGSVLGFLAVFVSEIGRRIQATASDAQRSQRAEIGNERGRHREGSRA